MVVLVGGHGGSCQRGGRGRARVTWSLAVRIKQFRLPPSLIQGSGARHGNGFDVKPPRRKSDQSSDD